MYKSALLLSILVSVPVLAAEGRMQAGPSSEGVNWCGYTPPCYNLECGLGFSVSGDFLYWYGAETGLPYALKAQSVQMTSTDETGLDTEDGNVFLMPNTYEYFSTNWKAGYRAAVGWEGGCDGWDLNVSWTYYTNKDKKKQTVTPFLQAEETVNGFLTLAPGAFIPPPNGEALYSPWTNPSLNPQTSTAITANDVQGVFNALDFFDQISAKWSLQVNQIDGELGRCFQISPCFNVRPVVGIRALATKTPFTTEGSRESLFFSNFTIPVVFSIIRERELIRTIRTKINNRFSGLGLSLGGGANWKFTDNLALYSNVGAALLWGEFKGKRSDELQFFSDFSLVVNGVPGTLITDANLKAPSKNRFYAMQPMLDLGLGFQWKSSFCSESLGFLIELGWEHHILFDHNPRMKLSNGVISLFPGQFIGNSGFADVKTTYGDIVIGGLVVKAQIDF